MSDLREQCVSEEPTHKKQCTLPANHDVHRNAGTAWSTDHEAWRAEMDAKDTEIAALKAELALHEAAAPATNDLAKRQRERAERAEAQRDRLRLAWQSARVRRRSARILIRELGLTNRVLHGQLKKTQATITRVEALVAMLRARDEIESDDLADLIASALAQPGDQTKET